MLAIQLTLLNYSCLGFHQSCHDEAPISVYYLKYVLFVRISEKHWEQPCRACLSLSSSLVPVDMEKRKTISYAFLSSLLMFVGRYIYYIYTSTNIHKITFFPRWVSHIYIFPRATWWLCWHTSFSLFSLMSASIHAHWLLVTLPKPFFETS